MHAHLPISSDLHGHPLVVVPCSELWDFVEFLSFHRVLVEYHFGASDFSATFQHRTPASVQELIREWEHEDVPHMAGA